MHALSSWRVSALIYSAVVCIHITPCQECRRVVMCRSFCFILVCVFLVDCLQSMKTILAWLELFSARHPPWSTHWASSWCTSQRFTAGTQDFLYFGVCHVAGTGLFALIHSVSVGREIRWLWHGCCGRKCREIKWQNNSALNSSTDIWE